MFIFFRISSQICALKFRMIYFFLCVRLIFENGNKLKLFSSKLHTVMSVSARVCSVENSVFQSDLMTLSLSRGMRKVQLEKFKQHLLIIALSLRFFFSVCCASLRATNCQKLREWLVTTVCNYHHLRRGLSPFGKAACL